MAIQISPIPAFSDNYIWLLDNGAGEAAVVDPGDSDAVLAVLQARQLTLGTILITHHHFDHTGGIEKLKAATRCTVFGPRNPTIAGVDLALGEGEQVTLLGDTLSVIAVPGHTLDHIAYLLPGDAAGAPGALFCGDTLFAGGCGRLFEGTAAMMRASLAKLSALPLSTRIYCAHEYTLANLQFAEAVEPSNAALQQRIIDSRALRAQSLPTVPSTLALELATNPFLRVTETAVRAALHTTQNSANDDVANDDLDGIFGALRSWKDQF